MNEYLKYIYILLIIVIIIISIILLTRLKKLMIKIALTSGNVNKITDGISLANRKVDEIKQTKDSFKFFANIYIIFIVLKHTLKAYKKFKKDGIKKAFIFSCINNASKISKMI